jgi:hypothetical protein
MSLVRLKAKGVDPHVNDPVIGPLHRSHRRVIMPTYQAHGASDFTNLLVTKEDGAIVWNPHIANCCVLRLNQRALHRGV